MQITDSYNTVAHNFITDRRYSLSEYALSNGMYNTRLTITGKKNFRTLVKNNSLVGYRHRRTSFLFDSQQMSNMKTSQKLAAHREVPIPKKTKLSHNLQSVVRIFSC